MMKNNYGAPEPDIDDIIEDYNKYQAYKKELGLPYKFHEEPEQLQPSGTDKEIPF